MASECLLALDIGTESSRAALVDLEGRVVGNGRSVLELQTPRPGWAEQDPQVWWETSIKNIHTALTEGAVSPGKVLAVGVSGQMHGVVPLGPEGQLLSHGVQLWCDKRAASLVEDFLEDQDNTDLPLISGTPPAPSWFGFKIKWLQVHEPDLYDRTWKFVVPKDFVNFQLTGVPSIDPSEASGSFLMDAAREAWSEEIIRSLRLDADKLPAISGSSSVIGRVTPEAARATGLVEGTPVVGGGGDMLCALLAAGVTQPGRACDITGSASHLSIFAESPVRDKRLMNLHLVTPGWISFGIVDCGGGSLKWFKDALCQEEVRAAEGQGRSPYALLDDQAARVEPGSEGLLFFPYLFGERTMGTPDARGVFFGLTARHNKGAMARAIMEGVTLELRRSLEIVEAAGIQVVEVRTTGGGAQSALWSQIKADIYRKPVVTFEVFEGSILGAAILAGVGAGAYPDASTASDQLARLGRVFRPDPAPKARYDHLYGLFKTMHDAMQGPFHRFRDLP